MAGLNILTLGSGKTYTNMVALGISNMRTSGSTVYFTVAATGEEVSVTLPTPADGISITNVEVNASKELIVTLSDNTKVNAGVIPTVKGDKGDAFTYDDFTTEQLESLKGQDGVSPTITENADNTDKIYKLDITTADSTFTTPNLKGADGQGGTGGSGEENKIDSISVNGVNVSPDVNKNVDITVPDAYDDTALSQRVTNIESDYLKADDISGKVDKVEGKSLISDTEIARLASVDNYDDTDIRTELANKADTTAIPSKVSVLENDSKYQTESDVTTTLSDYATKTYVGEQIANAEHLKREIVTVLPSDTEASDNIIYMLKVESTTGNDKYREYMKIDGTVQMVGDTSVDLTDYAKSVDIPTTVAELSDSADYAKKTDLHSHTNKTVLDGITEEKVTAWDKAQENIIESVKINDQEITPDDNKAVNIDLTGYAEHNEIIGENLIPFPYADGMSKTMNGIEYTVNPDGSVTAVGTATETSAFVLAKYLSIDPNATYILSGDLDDEITYKSSAILFNAETNSGTSYWNYGKDEPVIFTGISVLANFRIRVTKDETVNQTFYPMLEIGNIPHKYQQYKLSRNNLREDIDELKKLDDKLENQFNIASGDYITLTDSVDGNIVELGVKGNSEQKQLQGYNLIPFPYYSESGKSSGGLTFTYGDDFNITVNGTISSSYAGFAIARNIKVDAVNKKYMLIGLPTTGSGTTHKLRVRYIFPDGTTSDFTNCYNVNGDILDKKDSTYEGATMEIDLMCYDDKDNFQVRPMLVEVAEDGSYPTEYEAYCGGVPSPSPSYPQEIKSVGDDGSLVVKSRGKNLIPYPYDDGVRTNVGLTMTSLPNGMVNVNGTNTGVSGLFNFNYPTRSLIKLDPSKTYAFFNPLKTDRKDQITLGIRWYLEGQEISVQTGTNTSIAAHGNSNGAVIRSGFSYAYVYLYGYNSGKTFNNVLFAPMLVEVNEDGTYPTDYEIYKSSTSTIPLSEPLRAIGDVKDEITYQDDKWGVLRRIGKYVIDGTENLVLDSAHIADCGISVRMGNYTNILNGISVVSENTRDMVTDYLGCRELDHVPYYDSSSTIDYGSGIYRTSGNVWLTFGAADIEKMGITKDADSVKTWLSSHNITVHYPLGSPVFEPFADQTLPYLSTYDGVTNISNDDALSAEMTVKYPTTDASGVGSRNESRIAELAKDTDESLSSIGKCKNLLNPTLQTTTKNGITCTANGDGTYNIVGTNNTSSNAEFIFDAVINGTGQRKLLGVPKDSSGIILQTNYDGSWGQSLYWDTGNGVVLPNIEKLQSLAILVYAGATVNHTIKPMITTDLNATYDDFVPYTGDGETLTDDVAELKNDLGTKAPSSSIGDGSKNLMPPIKFGEGFVYNNMTFSNTDDGGIYTSGTTSVLTLRTTDNFELKAGTYILTGTPSGTPSGTELDLFYSDGTAFNIWDRGSGVTFTLNEDTVVYVRLRIPSNTTLDATWYPMIRRAEISDATYAPYAPNNIELSKSVPKTFMYRDVNGGNLINIVTNYTAKDMSVFIIYQKSSSSTSDEAYVYWKNDTSTDWLYKSNTADVVQFGIATIPPGSTLQLRVQDGAVCKFAFAIVTQ